METTTVSKETEEKIKKETEEKVKKQFSREQWFFFILTACLIIAFGVWYFTRSKAEKTVLSCWSGYHWYWKLDDVTQDPDTGRIDAHFQYRKHDSREHEKWLKSLEKPYRKLTEKFPEYVVNVHYNYGYDGLFIFTQNDGLNIYSNQNSHSLSLQEMTELFPETKRLCLFGYHSDIEEIEGFENLQSVGISPEITSQEQQKINELFPECEILDSPYDLIMDYFY